MSAPRDTMKTIAIDEVRPGMFVERLDRSWLTTPFVRHRFLLKDEQDIALLKRYGIRRVVIDTSKSVDLTLPSPVAPSASARVGSAQVAEAPAEPKADVHEPKPDESASATTTSPGRTPSREQVNMAAALHAEALCAVERMFAGTTSNVRMNSPALRTMLTRMGRQLAENPNAALTALRLQQLRRFDHNLFAHAVDVSVLTMAVGIEQRLAPLALEELAMGALLHDIGEMRLPRNLVRKTGAYAEHERDLMMHHPALGVALLNGADISDTVRRIIREHHERLDGSGYPAKLEGHAIAPESQLVGLVDIYDALVTSRNGRPAIPPPQAIRRLYQLGLGRQFDPRIVEHVIQCLGVYPIGSLVELNTGERAVVIAGNRDLSVKPTLKVIADATGRLYAEPLLLDLAAPEHASSTTAILRDLDPGQEQYEVALYLEGVV